jgi:hypothetical protein
MPKKRKTNEISAELSSAVASESVKRRQTKSSKQTGTEMMSPASPIVPTAALPPSVANGKARQQRVPQSKKVQVKVEVNTSGETIDTTISESNLMYVSRVFPFPPHAPSIRSQGKSPRKRNTPSTTNGAVPPFALPKKPKAK